MVVGQPEAAQRLPQHLAVEGVDDDLLLGGSRPIGHDPPVLLGGHRVEEVVVVVADVTVPGSVRPARHDIGPLGGQRTEAPEPLEKRDPVEQLEADLRRPRSHDDGPARGREPARVHAERQREHPVPHAIG